MELHRQVSQVFQALADPTRLGILAILTAGEACASDVHGRLGMSQPRVARHLKILVDAGLLDARRDGRFVRYAIGRDPALARLVAAALGLVPATVPAAGSNFVPAGDGGPVAPVGSRLASGPTVAPVEEAASDAPRGAIEDFLL